MRLFVAAELPSQVHDALAETSARLRESVHGRYVAPDSLHVTLAFMGEVSGGQLPAACAALDEACLGQPSLRVSLGALGSFGRRRRATLWQGFSAGVDELGALAGDIREVLAAYGFAYDEKAFVPHVTLMRAADVAVGVVPMPQLASGVVEAVSLYKSDLSGERPRYEALHTVALAPLEED